MSIGARMVSLGPVQVVALYALMTLLVLAVEMAG